MIQCNNASELRNALAEYRKGRKRIGFVPTMGALHDGHLYLVASSAKECDVTVCSIFVNPTQFNERSDFDRYPRNFDQDLSILENSPCDVVYMPQVQELYPHGLDHQLDYDIPSITHILEGKHRPGFLQGVVTVVMALFDKVQPTHVYFGLKDYQQYLMVKGAAEHYQMGVTVKGMQTQRNEGGLALSSRNKLLTPEELKRAEVLHDMMQMAGQQKGKKPIDEICQSAMQKIADQGLKPEYFEVRQPHTLNNVDQWHENENYIVLCAAKLGHVRLMDNLSI